MSGVRGGMETDDDLQPSRATVSAEEAEFFDRVKKYIGNKATYRAFLKLLNLFSQQILDQNLLVARVESFIGGNRELFDWFKTLVGYDTKEDFLDNEPRSKEKLDLAHCLSYGPSYRRVPKEVKIDIAVPTKQLLDGRIKLVLLLLLLLFFIVARTNMFWA